MGASCFGGLNAKLGAFVGAVFVGAPNEPNMVLLLCGVLELLPNVKNGFADDAGGLVLAEKLNPPLDGCCDDDEPNVNIAGVVAVSPKAGAAAFPKARVLGVPKSDGITLLDDATNVGTGFTAGVKLFKL